MKCCVICEQEKHIGIHLYKAFICVTCERQLVQTTPADERYNDYVNKLKEGHRLLLYS